MEARTLEGRRASKDKLICKDDYIGEEDVEDEMEEEEGVGGGGFFDDEKKKGVAVAYGKRGGSGTGGVSPPSCQVEKCGADLTEAKRYHRRHKVCEAHAKAPAAIVSGLRQRFCQQCSRFHELAEFDETKRSCRRRLAGHNERRRKNSTETYGEGSSRKGVGTQMRESHQSRQGDERGRFQINIPGNPTCNKRSQIR